MLTVSAVVQLEFAVSFTFFSRYFGCFVNRYTITRFAVVLSTRDKLSLVTEVRIFFRVVVYRLNKRIF